MGNRAVIKRALGIISPTLIIGAVVLFAYIPYLSKHFLADPRYQHSGVQITAQNGVTSGTNTIDPNVGFTTQALGRRAILEWGSGIPWWNHYEGIGTPLAGEMQSAAMFPFIVFFKYANGWLIMHILLQILAGTSTFYLLKRLRLHFGVALFGGIAFALNGTFAWITNAAFNPVAFLPLLVLGLQILSDESGLKKGRAWVLVAIAVALSLYSGFPETAYIDAIFAVGWSIALIFIHRKNLPRVKFFIMYALLGGVVGILLAAPILTAFLDFLPFAYIGGHKGVFSNVGVPRLGLAGLFLPYVYGPIFAYYNLDQSGKLIGFWGSVGGFVSISLLPLAILSLFTTKNRTLKVFLCLWFVLAVARTYALPFSPSLWNLIPGVSSIAIFRYIPATFEFSIIVLAAFGLQGLIDKEKVRSRVYSILAIAVLMPLLGIGLYEGYRHDLLLQSNSAYWVFGSLGAAAVLYLLVWGFSLFRSRVAVVFISILATAEIAISFIIPQLAAPRKASLDMKPVAYLQQHLGDYRFYSMGPVFANYGSFYGIASVNVNDLPIPSSFAKYSASKLDTNIDPTVFTGANRKDNAGPSVMDEFLRNIGNYRNIGVKYVAVRSDDQEQSKLGHGGLKLVMSSPTTNIYEIANAAPYFSTSTQCQQRTLSWLKVSISCAAPAELTRRELYMPGWKAIINNRSVPVVEASDIFQKISLPKGDSQVSFSFAPPGMNYAYLLLVVGAGLVIGECFRSVFDRKRKPADAAQI